MKNFFVAIISLLVCLPGFTQSEERRFFENNPELGGDAVINSSDFRVEKGVIHKTFEVNVSEAGAYYLDAWIKAPSTKEGFMEYKVSVNGVVTGFSLKPQTGGWHSLALTDAKKSVTAVRLNKGVNIISVIGRGTEIPNVEFIKLSSNLSRSGIPGSDYRKFVESIKSNKLNEVYNVNTSRTGLTGGDSTISYNYYLDMPFFIQHV